MVVSTAGVAVRSSYLARFSGGNLTHAGDCATYGGILHEGGAGSVGC